MRLTCAGAQGGCRAAAHQLCQGLQAAGRRHGPAPLLVVVREVHEHRQPCLDPVL